MRWTTKHGRLGQMMWMVERSPRWRFGLFHIWEIDTFVLSIGPWRVIRCPFD